MKLDKSKLKELGNIALEELEEMCETRFKNACAGPKTTDKAIYLYANYLIDKANDNLPTSPAEYSIMSIEWASINILIQICRYRDTFGGVYEYFTEKVRHAHRRFGEFEKCDINSLRDAMNVYAYICDIMMEKFDTFEFYFLIKSAINPQVRRVDDHYILFRRQQDNAIVIDMQKILEWKEIFYNLLEEFRVMADGGKYYRPLLSWQNDYEYKEGGMITEISECLKCRCNRKEYNYANILIYDKDSHSCLANRSFHIPGIIAILTYLECGLRKEN